MLPVLVLSRFPFLRRGQIPGLEKIQGDWTQRRGWVFQATSKGQGEEGGGHQGCLFCKAGVWHKDPSCWLNTGKGEGKAPSAANRHCLAVASCQPPAHLQARPKRPWHVCSG